MRLGVDEAGVTELMAVTEHARAMSTTARALLLERLDDEAGLVAPLNGEPAEEQVRVCLAEMWTVLSPAAGGRDVPVVWRMLARKPHHLVATWRKEQVVMREGALTARDKRRTALGVTMAVGGRYMIAYHAAVLRHAGDGDEEILEVLGVVDHYTTLNTLSEGMQIPSDIVPESRG
jgi:alkylhydroperoxidase/carboxymuconolactone decarboxylase family protein YurZ